MSTELTSDPILEVHAFAAVQIDASCNILSGNAKSAQLWRRRSDLFRVEAGRFSIVDTAAHRQFAQRLASMNGTITQFTIAVPDAVVEATHWLVVRPLSSTKKERADLPDALPHPPARARDDHFLLSFRLAEDFPNLIDPARLSSDLGLTPTEARIVAALAEGSSVREYVEKAGGTSTTTRWHLDNVRKKLGCASQRDLVRTVLLVSV